jgi:hypothetical protein
MGRKSKDKGYRFERWLVNFLQGHGFAAERMPLSGALGGRYGGDVSSPVLGDDWRLEAKCRASGFAQLYDWLGTENHALVVRADRREPLIVMPLRRAMDVLKRAEDYRTRRGLA